METDQRIFKLCLHGNTYEILYNNKAIDTANTVEMAREQMEMHNLNYCEIGSQICLCGWNGDYPKSGCPRCGKSFVA